MDRVVDWLEIGSADVSDTMTLPQESCLKGILTTKSPGKAVQLYLVTFDLTSALPIFKYFLCNSRSFAVQFYPHVTISLLQSFDCYTQLPHNHFRPPSLSPARNPDVGGWRCRWSLLCFLIDLTKMDSALAPTQRKDWTFI